MRRTGDGEVPQCGLGSHQVSGLVGFLAPVLVVAAEH